VAEVLEAMTVVHLRLAALYPQGLRAEALKKL